MTGSTSMCGGRRKRKKLSLFCCMHTMCARHTCIIYEKYYSYFFLFYGIPHIMEWIKLTLVYKRSRDKIVDLLQSCHRTLRRSSPPPQPNAFLFDNMNIIWWKRTARKKYVVGNVGRHVRYEVAEKICCLWWVDINRVWKISPRCWVSCNIQSWRKCLLFEKFSAWSLAPLRAHPSGLSCMWTRPNAFTPRNWKLKAQSGLDCGRML